MSSIPDEELEQNNNQLDEEIEILRKEIEKVKKIVKEQEEKRLYNNAIIIQCFLRVSYSKKKANHLRFIPDNLFDPEFSLIRKKMFNIDDSCFKL